MFTIKGYGSAVGVFFLCIVFSCTRLAAENLSVEVQENTEILIKTNKCVDCNLAGADLNRLNLSGADLRGADLSNAALFLVDLSYANMTGAILRGTKFGGADLAGADLRGADLRGAKMSGAYLVGSKFDGSFAEVSVSDDETLRDVVEQTYIPDDSVPKQPLEKKQVNIADRRDFGPVPPQLDSEIPMPIEGIQEGPTSKSGPPKKAVSPVSDIVIANEAAQLPSTSQRKEESTQNEVNSISSSAGENLMEVERLRDDKKKVPMESVPSLIAQSKVKTVETKADSVKGIENDAEATTTDEHVDPEKTDLVPVEKMSDDSVTEIVFAEKQDHLVVTEEPVGEIIESEITKEKKDSFVPEDVSQEESEPETVTQEASKPEVIIPKASDSEAVIPDESKLETVAGGAEAMSRPSGQAIDAEAIDSATASTSTEFVDLQKKVKKYRKCYECNLAGSDFAGVNFDGADLEGTDFTGANLERTDFEDANLKNVSFKNANLKEAKFNRADLYKANFDGADLTGTEFKKALIDETNFENTIGYENLMITQPE